MKKNAGIQLVSFASHFDAGWKSARLAGLTCFFSILIHAQQKEFTLSNAHAHNDYEHTVPFYTAFNAGFGSIEADIFPVDGILCVAHSKREIQPNRTLKQLYLEPLLKELKVNTSRRVKILIDIKEDYRLSLQLLQKEIEPLIPYLSTQRENKQITILISGQRPTPKEYEQYPPYIFFDDDLKIRHSPAEWKRVGQVSLQFSNYSKWNASSTSEPIPAEVGHLKNIIDSVHHSGKTIRFWGAPDNEASWKLQMKLNVDLVGTDKIEEFTIFLKNSAIKND